MKIKIYRRVLPLLLAVAVMSSGMTIPAATEVTVPARTSSNSITGFAELPEATVTQAVYTGTSLEKLDLPKTLTVTVTTGSALTAILDSGDISGVEEELSEDTVSGEISVTWTSDPVYKPETEDTYVFTPVLPENYALAEGVSLPEISVTVGTAASMMLMAGTMSGASTPIDVSAAVTDDTLQSAGSNSGDAWAYDTGTKVVTLNNGSFTITGITTARRIVVSAAFEEVAVILQSYVKAAGRKLPVTQEEITFADNGSIGSNCKDAVTAMQQAGIMTGDQNNRFNPGSNVTRAEVSSILHRYIKLAIGPAAL